MKTILLLVIFGSSFFFLAVHIVVTTHSFQFISEWELQHKNEVEFDRRKFKSVYKIISLISFVHRSIICANDDFSFLHRLRVLIRFICGIAIYIYLYCGGWYIEKCRWIFHVYTFFYKEPLWWGWDWSSLFF